VITDTQEGPAGQIEAAERCFGGTGGHETFAAHLIARASGTFEHGHFHAEAAQVQAQ
jgi:hypothetical protein